MTYLEHPPMIHRTIVQYMLKNFAGGFLGPQVVLQNVEELVTKPVIRTHRYKVELMKKKKQCRIQVALLLIKKRLSVYYGKEETITG